MDSWEPKSNALKVLSNIRLAVYATIELSEMIASHTKEPVAAELS